MMAAVAAEVLAGKKLHLLLLCFRKESTHKIAFKHKKSIINTPDYYTTGNKRQVQNLQHSLAEKINRKRRCKTF